MGKKAKEHRKKVEKRNAKIKSQKSAMQKAFDILMKQQIEKLKENNNLNVSLSGQPLSFSVMEENEELINEINIESVKPTEFIELKTQENKEEEE